MSEPSWMTKWTEQLMEIPGTPSQIPLNDTATQHWTLWDYLGWVGSQVRLIKWAVVVTQNFRKQGAMTTRNVHILPQLLIVCLAVGHLSKHVTYCWRTVRMVPLGQRFLQPPPATAYQALSLMQPERQCKTSDAFKSISHLHNPCSCVFIGQHKLPILNAKIQKRTSHKNHCIYTTEPHCAVLCYWSYLGDCWGSKVLSWTKTFLGCIYSK